MNKYVNTLYFIVVLGKFWQNQMLRFHLSTKEIYFNELCYPWIQILCQKTAYISEMMWKMVTLPYSNVPFQDVQAELSFFLC